MLRPGLLLALFPLLALAREPVPPQPAPWPRATPLPPGSAPPAQPYAAWPDDQALRMRQLNIRFCANLRMALRGQPFPFADDTACIARQVALLPTLCNAEGRSLRRPASFCFSAVNTQMRAGLNQLMDGVAPTASGTGAQPAAARPGPAPPPLRLVDNPLPMPRRPGAAGGPELSAAAVFRRAEGSIWVVMVDAAGGERGGMQGSGVAISPRLLLTNCHVVRRGGAITLRRDNRSLRARIAHADLEGDRCVLQTEEPALSAIAGVRPHAQLQVGERAYAIGAPLGLTLTLTEGIVSATRHSRGQALVQSSAATSFGSSGGGLFDSRGNLVGITTFGVGANSAFNFAIAAEDFWRLPAARRASP